MQSPAERERAELSTVRAFFSTELSLYVSGLVLHLHERQTQQNFCSSYKNYPCYELVAVTAQTILAKSFFGSYGKTILDVNFYSYCNN